MAESGYYIPIPELRRPDVEAALLTPIERLSYVTNALLAAWGEDSDIVSTWSPSVGIEAGLLNTLVVQDYCDGGLMYRHQATEGEVHKQYANRLKDGTVVDLASGMNLDRPGYWIDLGSHPRSLHLTSVAALMCYGALRDSVDYRVQEANDNATPRVIRNQRALRAARAA